MATHDEAKSKASAPDAPPELSQVLAALTPEQQDLFLIIMENAGDQESFER